MRDVGGACEPSRVTGHPAGDEQMPERIPENAGVVYAAPPELVLIGGAQLVGTVRMSAAGVKGAAGSASLEISIEELGRKLGTEEA